MQGPALASSWADVSVPQGTCYAALGNVTTVTNCDFPGPILFEFLVERFAIRIPFLDTGGRL